MASAIEKVSVPVDAVQAQALAQHHHQHPAQAQGQVYHRGVVQFHQPSPQPSLEQHPAHIPRRGGGPSCLCSLGVVALLGCVSLCSMVLLEAPFVALENQLVDNRMRAAPFRKDHAPSENAPPVTLGLWDEEKRITSLQLVVCLSLALGVDETRVQAHAEGSYFYTCYVHREGAWVVEAVNTAESRFLQTLNAQAQRFGARLVITHNAQSVTNRSTNANG